MITITRIHDKLNAEEWQFSTMSSHTGKIRVIFESYYLQYKENEKQRKWRPEKQYSRLNQMTPCSDYTSETVPLPADVIAEVRQKILESIEVVK